MRLEYVAVDGSKSIFTQSQPSLATVLHVVAICSIPLHDSSMCTVATPSTMHAYHTAMQQQAVDSSSLQELLLLHCYVLWSALLSLHPSACYDIGTLTLRSSCCLSCTIMATQHGMNGTLSLTLSLTLPASISIG